jgi:DNA-binding MarR family transcriptional regulator
MRDQSAFAAEERASRKARPKPANTETRDPLVRPAAEGDLSFGPLPDLLGYQIRQAQSAIFRDFANTMADLNVTPGEFSLLTLLDANPGTSQVRLAAAYKLDKSTLSLAISRLVRRGLVRRSRSQQDQRIYSLWLAEPGRALLHKLRERVDGQENAMNSVLLPGERERLLDMLQRIVRRLNR